MASTDARKAVSPSPPQPAAGGAPPPIQKVPYLDLFRFATFSDRALVVLGCLFAAANGVIFPCFSLIFGQLLNSFNTPAVDLAATINRLSLYFLIISLGAFVAGLLQNALPMLASERQMARLRAAYLAALLRQPPAWHDTRKDAGEVASRLSADTLLIAGGIGEKLTGGIQHAVTFLAGLAVGFSTSWKLTLVIMSCVPLLVGIVVALKESISRFEKDSADAYAKAGDAAGEGVSLIRAVSASGGEAHEVARYDSHLAAAEAAGVSKGLVMAVCVGGIFSTMFVTYAVALAAGAQFVLDSRAANAACRYNPLEAGCFSGGDVIQCFMAVLIGAFALGQAGPNIAALGSAQAAAYHLWAVCDEVPAIDSEKRGGYAPAEPGSSASGGAG
jgi:ATP-binding cassette subfamily B (MDR/TAP) protein 1